MADHRIRTGEFFLQEAKPTVSIIRGIGFGLILFLLITWLTGAVLFVQGISTDLDFILRNTFFYSPIWTPDAVRTAAEEANLQPSTLPWLWLTLETTIVATFGVAGLVMFWRKKDLFGVYLGVSLVVIGTSITGPVISTVSSIIPEAQLFLLFLSGVGYLAFASFLYVFPNGRFIPPWSKWLALAFTVIILYQTYITFKEPAATENLLVSIIPLIYFLLGVIFQVYRYLRISGPVERQQTKWVLVAFTLFISIAFLFFFFSPNSSSMQYPPSGSDLIGFFFFYTSLTLVTIFFLIALGFAIFRYRLYGIDIIIRRTLVYGGLTIMLVTIYFGIVVLLQGIFTKLGGQQSPVVIVFSTLVIAALFNPMRKRIQNTIDRRFYRSKYDAEKSLTRFIYGLREEVDVDLLSSQLLLTTQEILQPAHISFWTSVKYRKNKQKTDG